MLKSFLKVAALALLGMALHSRVFSLGYMLSDSMAPTLRATFFWQDFMLVDRLSLKWRAPERGDILFLRIHPPNQQPELVFKRVAALPGERIEVRGGKVIVNGGTVDSPRIFSENAYTNEGHASPGVVIEVASESWFVLGDNSFDSFDSRYWGAAGPQEVLGLCAMIVWPLHRFGPPTWRKEISNE